jgi:hypothetical protein
VARTCQPARPLNIFDPIEDASVWGGGRWFRDRQTWFPWFVVLKTIFGLPLTLSELHLFRKCTGRREPSLEGYREAWFVVGRRGGKSRVLALVAVFLSVYVDWTPYLSPGEVGTVKIIATDRRQARVIYRYCRAFLLHVPALAHLVEKDSDDEIVLTNGIVIEIQTANFRSVRGYTVIAALCDEIAFWRSDETSANPDAEILGALRPAMATVPESLLLCASSPYSRRGQLWEHYRRYFGRDDARPLVWQADTSTMNPTIPASEIAEAYERDFAWAEAEFGAQFRTDLEAFVSRDVVDAVIMSGVREIPPTPGRTYRAFVDPSGGSGDSFAIAIGHAEGQRGVLDAISERRPPFSPESVTKEFADLCRSYGVYKVMGDRYAGSWPQERFAEHGIIYETAERSKSELYVEFLPLLNSRRVSLLDHPQAINQLCALERRTGRGTGRDIVDHPPKSHDDLANVMAGVLTLVAGGDERSTIVRRYLLGNAA